MLASNAASLGPSHSNVEWWLIVLFMLQGGVIWLFARRRYLVRTGGCLRPAFTELQQFSSFLLSGAVIAQLWAHGNWDSYSATMHGVLLTIPFLELPVDLHFLANEVVMTFFFGIAAKELAEAVLKPNGSLRGVKAVLPLGACLGGIIFPACVYRMFCTPDMASAWAVPCATDIAFAWLGARAIWGASHPAIPFLLALAIADDFIGMGIIAIFYPQGPFYLPGLLLLAAGMILALFCRYSAKRFHWLARWEAYIVPGILCWFGLWTSGLHPALAMVFVVPFIPMDERDDGLFKHDASTTALDPLNQFERVHKPFVDTGLFFFGLANAGVVWWGETIWDQNSWAVFLGLGLGKTLGISLCTILGFVGLKIVRGRAELPVDESSGKRLTWYDVPLLGLLGAMGFTVALFVANAAGGSDALRAGALASFLYLGMAIVLGRHFIHGRRPLESPEISEAA